VLERKKYQAITNPSLSSLNKEFMMLPLDATLSKNKEVPWRIIEGEAILVKVDKGEVIHLNEVATEIWRIIDGKKKVSEIIDCIYNTFKMEREEVERDTLEFLKMILDKKIVTM